MATIAEKIADLAGSDMDATLVPSYEDLIRSAYNFVADLIPANSTKWYNSYMQGTRVEANDNIIIHGTINSRIISLKRKDATSGEFYACREVSWQEGIKKGDSSSIFYGGKGVRNPIYYVNQNGKLMILPAPDALNFGSLLHFRYIDGIDLSADLEAGTISPGGQGAGFPREAEHAAQIRAAILLLQARVSNAVQDDEDMELLQLLQGQIAGLQQLFKEELQKLNVPDKKQGVVS